MIRSPASTVPLPGEALFSVAGRWLHTLGVPTAGPTVRALFGETKERGRFPLALPVGLRGLVERFEPLNGLDTDCVVERFTAGPVYRPFLSAHRWAEVVARLVDGQSVAAVRMRLGVVRGGGDSQMPMHCPYCMQELQRSCGAPYWLMRFALPHVTACPKHHLALVAVRSKSTIRLSQNACLGAPVMPPVHRPAQVATEADCKLSRLLIDLHGAGVQPVPRTALVLTYLRRLDELGLLQSGGRVRRDALWRHLCSYWDSLDIGQFQCRRSPPAWLTGVHRVDHEQGGGTCLQHVLAIGALFGSIDAWKAALSAQAPGHEQGPKALTGPVHGTRNVQVAHWLEGPKEVARLRPISRDVLRGLRQGMSVREVAKMTGISVGRIYRRLRRDTALAGDFSMAALAREANNRDRAFAQLSGISTKAQRPHKRWIDRHWAARRRVLEG